MKVEECRNLCLYRYNKITGYWQVTRAVDEETAEEWLKVFERDEPGENFYVSRRKPGHNPIPKQF